MTITKGKVTEIIIKVDDSFLEQAKIKGMESKYELIRCKDCRWWDRLDDSPIGYCHACKHGYYSNKWEISIRRTYKEDFYCADAEREDNG